jgi:hypothetical protein
MDSSQASIASSTPDTGKRLIYMLLFAFVFWLLCWALIVTTVGQLILRGSGRTSDELTRFGAGLAVYARQVIEFLTFVTEIVPYPFTAWPRSG